MSVAPGSSEKRWHATSSRNTNNSYFASLDVVEEPREIKKAKLVQDTEDKDDVAHNQGIRSLQEPPPGTRKSSSTSKKIPLPNRKFSSADTILGTGDDEPLTPLEELGVSSPPGFRAGATTDDAIDETPAVGASKTDITADVLQGTDGDEEDLDDAQSFASSLSSLSDEPGDSNVDGANEDDGDEDAQETKTSARKRRPSQSASRSKKKKTEIEATPQETDGELNDDQSESNMSQLEGDEAEENGEDQGDVADDEEEERNDDTEDVDKINDTYKSLDTQTNLENRRKFSLMAKPAALEEPFEESEKDEAEEEDEVTTPTPFESPRPKSKKTTGTGKRKGAVAKARSMSDMEENPSESDIRADIDEASTPPATGHDTDDEEEHRSRRLEAVKELTKIETILAELKEQVYQERMRDLDNEIALIEEATHPDLSHLLKDIEDKRNARIRNAEAWRRYKIQDHVNEWRAAEALAYSLGHHLRAKLRSDVLQGLNTQRWIVEEEWKKLRDASALIPTAPGLPDEPILLEEAHQAQIEAMDYGVLRASIGFPLAPDATSLDRQDADDDLRLIRSSISVRGTAQ